MTADFIDDWNELNELYDFYESVLDASYITEEVTRTSKPIKSNATSPNNNNKKSVIGRMVDMVIGMIDKISSAISDFIQKIFMTKTERNNFSDFKRMVQSDPALSSKKVTVKSYKKYIESLDAEISNVNKSIKQVKTGSPIDLDSISDRCSKLLKGSAKAIAATTAIVSVEAMIRLAESDVEKAELINKSLKSDKAAMQALSAAIGSKNAEKVEKDIEKLSKEVGLRRLLANLKGRKFDTINDSIESVMKDVVNPISGKRLHGMLKDNPETGPVIKGAEKTAGKAVAKGAGFAAKTAAKTAAEKSGRVVQSTIERAARKVTGNKNIKVTDTETDIGKKVHFLHGLYKDYNNSKKVNCSEGELNERVNKLNDDMVFFADCIKRSNNPKATSELRTIQTTLSSEIAAMQYAIGQMRANDETSTDYYKHTKAEAVAKEGRKLYNGF